MRIRVALSVLLLALLPGCSSFMHVSDPTIDTAIGRICSLLAAGDRASLEAEAARKGLSLDDLLRTFQAACSLRLHDALPVAEIDGHMAAQAAPERWH